MNNFGEIFLSIRCGAQKNYCHTSTSLSIGHQPEALVTRAVISSKGIDAFMHTLVRADVIALINI